ncbi:hypothetical protein BG006_003608, partial [Podila minutissima]
MIRNTSPEKPQSHPRHAASAPLAFCSSSILAATPSDPPQPRPVAPAFQLTSSLQILCSMPQTFPQLFHLRQTQQAALALTRA